MGTVSRTQIRGALQLDGRGEIEFTMTAGGLSTISSLALQRTVPSPPVITAATIDRNPIVVARATGGRTCSDRNQCQNANDVTFTIGATGLDPAQDAVIVQFQLADGTFQELPLTASSGEWRLTVRQRTTKFREGPGRVFRFSAIRSADGATATTTILRDVISA